MTYADKLKCQMRVSKSKSWHRTYSRFKVNKDGTRDIVLVVRLVEKDIFAIAALGGPILENTLFVDAVFST